MFYDKDGNDIGYKENQNWWWDLNDPDHYRYADLDDDYTIKYFKGAEPPNVKEFVDVILYEYQRLTGKSLEKVMEFGAGGGWYLKEFQDRGLAVHAYEGSFSGLLECVSRGVAKINIDHVDLRLPIRSAFLPADLVICTEVAEHLEPPFHGTLVDSLVSHSNMIWFSAKPPNTNKPHIGHPGEMPLEYWIKLFEFFGFGCYMLSEEVFQKCTWRGRCIFFNKEVYDFK